ncbi:MAG TPA: MFS transporter [Acidimicrobiales bacterium]|nr:MFS transporter [Acidimicrobiales bacterium]
MAGRILVDVAPLKESRQFRLLFVAVLVTTLGSQLTVVAIPFQIYGETHSSLQVGLVSLAQLVPLVVGALIGGSVGDVVDRRRLLLWSSVGLSLTSTGLALNALPARPSVPVVYVVSATAAFLLGFSDPARTAAVPKLVGVAHLAAAFAFLQILFQVGSIVGPALSGQLIEHVGLPFVYGIDAVTYLMAMAVMALMDPLPPIAGARRPGIGSILEGIRFLKGRQPLQGVYLIDINAMVFGMPRALFPALSVHVFGGGASTLGYLYAAPGVGALIGATATGWVARLRRQGLAVIVAVIVWGAAVTVFGFVHVLWVSLVLLAVAGWADVVSAVLRNTILQTTIPDEFRSRLSAIQMAVVTGGPRLGDLESGAVAALVDVQFSIVSGGLACIVGAFVLSSLLPGFRRYRREDVRPEAPPPVEPSTG